MNRILRAVLIGGLVAAVTSNQQVVTPEVANTDSRSFPYTKWARDGGYDAGGASGGVSLAAPASSYGAPVGGGSVGGGYDAGGASGGYSSGGYSGGAVSSSYSAPVASYGVPDAGKGGYGGNPAQSYQYHYSIYPQMQGAGWGGEDEEGGDGFDMQSLISLIGLKGLKGLKAVKAAKKALFGFPILLPLLFPILLPLFLPILLLLAIPLLLFLPIPVITVPSGRQMQLGMRALNEIGSFDIVDRVEKALSASECVERISCEVGRVAKDLKYDGWLSSTLEKVPIKNKLMQRVTRATQKTQNCQRYTCGVISSLWPAQKNSS